MFIGENQGIPRKPYVGMKGTISRKKAFGFQAGSNQPPYNANHYTTLVKGTIGSIRLLVYLYLAKKKKENWIV